MQSQCNNEVETETPNARRDALSQAALVAGGAIVGTALLSQNARADGMNKMNKKGDVLTTQGMMGVPPIAQATFGSLLMPKSDVDILNFALILEHLEADFYTRAVQAHATRPYLSRKVPELAQKLRDDENAHVLAVSQRITDLGGTPVSKPTFQFPSEVFISQVAFLDFSATLEQNGVGAYLGAAPLLKRRDVLRFAASIYGIEARHTSMIRYSGGRVAAPAALEEPLSMMEVATRVAPLILAPGAGMMSGTMDNGTMMGTPVAPAAPAATAGAM